MLAVNVTNYTMIALTKVLSVAPEGRNIIYILDFASRTICSEVIP